MRFQHVSKILGRNYKKPYTSLGEEGFLLSINLKFVAPLEHAVQFSSHYFQQIMLNILGRTMKLHSMYISELGLNLFRL
jgi:hypothetical protein